MPERMPMYEPPDLGSLAIHLLNKIPSEEEEKTDTDKALLLMMEAMKGLVKGLQNQFTAIDTTFEDIKENGGGGGGQKEDKKNPYAIVKGDFNAQNVSNKVEEQESRLHEMTVQIMMLTGRTETAEEKVKTLDTLTQDTAAKVKKLVSDVKQLQMEAPLVGERIKMLLEQHQDFAAKIEPKFAPLENDVSVINGVLQLDQQFFTGKVSAMFNLTSPLFTVWDSRLDSLESDSGDLQKKVKNWCDGCDQLFTKLSCSRIAETVGESLVDSQRAKKKVGRGVSFGDAGDADLISQMGWGMGFEVSDLGKCLYFFQSVLNQMSTMEEMIKQWEVFHQSIETRIDLRVVKHIDDKISGVLSDPRQRDHALQLVHALSPHAEYHQVMTQLDMKVDKHHFQTFTAKLFEQVEGLNKLSSLQGQVLGAVRRTVYSEEKEGGVFGGAFKNNKPSRSQDVRDYGHITDTDITKMRPHRSIQTSTTSSETYKQAHMRLPKPPLSSARASADTPSHWAATYSSPRGKNMRPNSART